MPIAGNKKAGGAWVAATLAGCVALSAQGKPLKGMCDGLEPFRKLGDLEYVKPVVRLKPKEGVKATDVVFTIASKAGPIRVVAADDGTIVFPLTDALCEENPDIVSNQPDGTVRMDVSIDPQIPPAREFDYGRLEVLRRQWDEAISRQKLVYRLLAPSAKSFEIMFEPGKPATAEIRLPQGTRKLAADAKGELVIPFEPSWVAANPPIVLSDMPKRIALRFKG